MIYLGVDPSVNDAGLAVYDSVTQKLKTQTFQPLRTPTTTTVNIAAQINRAIFFMLQREKKPDYIVLEHPQFEDSVRGHKAAAKGYTLDLAFLVGYLSGASGLASANIFTPTPLEWKGNAPKTAIGHRFEKRYGLSAASVTDHEFEAAMMIDWLIKKVKP